MGSLVENFIREYHRIRDGLKYIKPFRLSYLRKVFSLLGPAEKIALGVLLAALLSSGLWSARSAYFALTEPIPGYGGTYKEGVLGQPRYLNPIFATSDADKSINQLLFSGLYRYSKDGALVPDLAETLPVISEDEKEYSVTLKPNVLWHNNEPLTADDIVFTIQTIQNPETNSPLRHQWLNTEVSKVDERTILFRNTDVSGAFIHNLILPIVQKKIWESIPATEFATDSNNLKPVGTGAYTVTEITQQTNGKIIGVTLKAFSDYHEGQAYIENINLKFFDTYEDLVTAFHSGEVQGAGIDAINTNASLSANTETATVHIIPLAQYQAAFFNISHPILSDKNVRKALALAVNKQTLISEVLNGRAAPIAGPFTVQQLRLPESSQLANIAAAKTLLDQAGWIVDPVTNERTKNGLTLKFNISTNDTSNNLRVAEFLANAWKELGINVLVTSSQTKDLTANVIRPRSFDALVFAQQLGADPDTFAFWHSSQIKDPGLNITGFNNAQADKLISQARTTTNKDEREEAYKMFAQILNDEVPAIFLNQSVYLYTVNNAIKGLELGVLYDPIYRFTEINRWYINESRAWK